MTETDAYERLLIATVKDTGVIDAQVMHWLAGLKEEGRDMSTVSVPMLAQIDTNGISKVRECAKILSIIDTIVALTATPAQLLELIKIPEVYYLELSGTGGSFDN